MGFRVTDHEEVVGKTPEEVLAEAGGGIGVDLQTDNPGQRLINMSMTDFISIKPSVFTEFAMRMPDKINQGYKPFSFDGRRYMRQIYDTPAKRRLLKAGRQVEKSTCLGNTLLSYACMITGLNALYVSPTNIQTKVFSQDRLKEAIETSDYLQSWTTTKLSDNVFLKKFINRSQITLRYAYLTADRVRGIPADVICLDELQDLLTDNIPVIEECAAKSHLKIFIYSGTPKSNDNTIQHYWTNLSTQNEWAVPCHRHSIRGPVGLIVRQHWNILSEDHIGGESMVCERCRQPITPQDEAAMWVSMNPEIRDDPSIRQPFEGFHIPQLMVPWITHDELLQKQKTYSRAKFFNEVLGESYDSGSRPLTPADITQNCEASLTMSPDYVETLRLTIGDVTPVYAGIDWGSGTDHSYTVISLGAYLPGTSKFTIFYVYRFEGPEMEPPVQLEKIKEIIHRFKVQKVACDYGGGHWPNDQLMRTFGWQRIMRYQYSQINEKVRWEDGKLMRWIVNRTEVMSDIFNAIKRGNVFRFPNWAEFKTPFADDMLNIFSEYNETRRMNEYKKSPAVTDDSFHSILFCFLASFVENPRPDVISPQAVSSDGAEFES